MFPASIILKKYDALPGMSQKLSTSKELGASWGRGVGRLQMIETELAKNFIEQVTQYTEYKSTL